MPDLTTYTTNPRTIPTLESRNARREAARLAREDQKRARLAHFRQLDRDAQESFNRKPARVAPKPRGRSRNPRPTERQGPLKPCAGTCGRMTRPRATRAKDAPGTVSRVRDGYCFTCNPGADSPTGIRPCTGPCGRPTRTRGTFAIPGTVARVHDGMCATCVRGKTVRPDVDTDALVDDYRAGMSIAALKAKHHIGKSTIYVILENVEEPRRRKGAA